MAKQTRSMVKVAEGIYRRPSGKYVVPVYNPRTGGKTYAGPGVPRGGFKTLKAAKEYKRDIEARKDDHGTSSESVADFAARWMRDFPAGSNGKARSESTRIHNEERIKAFVKEFGPRPMGSITRPEARRWVLGDEENGIPNRRGHLRAVRAMYADAARDGIVSGNPFARLGIPENDGRKNILVLSEDEVRLLVKCSHARWNEYGHEVFGPLIQVAAYTGMRPGELYALRWTCVDLAKGEVEVKRAVQQRTGKEGPPKNGTERTVVLLPQATAAFQLIPHRGDYVFTNLEGGQLAQRTHHYYWAPVRAMFWGGLPADRQEEIDPAFSFYELRHFYGTLLAMRWRMSPYEIADQMGHVDGGKLAMDTYIHPLSRDVRDSFRRRILEDAAEA